MIVHVTDDTFWDGPGSPLQCEAPTQNGCATIGSTHSYQSVVEALRSQEIWTFAFAAHVRPLSFGFIDTSAGFFVDYKDVELNHDFTSCPAGPSRGVVGMTCHSLPSTPPGRALSALLNLIDEPLSHASAAQIGAVT